MVYDDPVDCGIASMCKDRHVADDTSTIADVHRSPRQLAAYGLFAGHGGNTAADLCARNFVPNLLEDSTLVYDPERALRNACAALEAFVLAKSALDRTYYGTTLLAVLIVGQQMYIVNIGNSRAVLATKDGVQNITQEHDGSNAEEVERVRKSGGFFQDGKVNNLIRVTRSIGDLELKERKHITFPHRHMTDDIIIATPDIYNRRLSPRDYFMVLATAEVWEHLSNKTVVQIVSDALRKGESSRSCAKRVAAAALANGARGPLTVMLLIFATAKALQDKPVGPPSRKRTSRPRTLKRHSSNAEQELRAMNNKARAQAAIPPFVRELQAREENMRAIQQQSIPHTSPVNSPSAPPVSSRTKTEPEQALQIDEGFQSLPFLALNVPPHTAKKQEAMVEMRQSGRSDTTRGTTLRHKPKGKITRSHSLLGFQRLVSSKAEPSSAEMPSRTQIDMSRQGETGENIGERKFDDRDVRASGGSNSGNAPRMSELTASGATGVGESLEASFGDMSVAGDFGADFMDYTPSGPSKVRYKEDGTVQSSKLSFLKEFGRSFGKRR